MAFISGIKTTHDFAKGERKGYYSFIKRRTKRAKRFFKVRKRRRKGKND